MKSMLNTGWGAQNEKKGVAPGQSVIGAYHSICPIHLLCSGSLTAYQDLGMVSMLGQASKFTL